MFEPGSTMKPFTVAAALESGRYNTRSLFNTNPGTFRVINKTIRDHDNYGVIDLATLITKSSNIASAQIALALPRGKLGGLLGTSRVCAPAARAKAASTSLPLPSSQSKIRLFSASFCTSHDCARFMNSRAPACRRCSPVRRCWWCWAARG